MPRHNDPHADEERAIVRAEEIVARIEDNVARIEESSLAGATYQDAVAVAIEQSLLTSAPIIFADPDNAPITIRQGWRPVLGHEGTVTQERFSSEGVDLISEEIDWDTDWMKTNSFPKGVHDDIRRLLEKVEQYRDELEDQWKTPNVRDSMRFAITEMGEYIDADLRRNPDYNRNHKKKLKDPRDELGDAAIMLATAISQLPQSGADYIWRERIINQYEIANALNAIAKATYLLFSADEPADLTRGIPENVRERLERSNQARSKARAVLLSALAECFMLCGEDSLYDISVRRLDRIKRRINETVNP